MPICIRQDDEDVYILSKISDIVHALFGTMLTEFLPAFDELLSRFVKLLVSHAPIHVVSKYRIKCLLQSNQWLWDG